MSGARTLALWLVGTRLLVDASMVAGTYFHRTDDPSYWHGQSGSLHYRQVPIRALDVFGRWDTDFYLGIARNGYPPLESDPGWIYNAAFFPLYPALIRGVSVLLGGLDLFLAGVAVANVMLVLGAVYLRKLARRDEGDGHADLAVACLLAYPGSHFFSCVYPESTALFLGVFALSCARAGLAAPAGLACGLAAVTRSSGILLSLPVLYELCRTDAGSLRPRWRALWLVCPAVTLGLHLALNQQLYGDPLYFVRVQGAWGRRPSFFLEPFLRLDLSLDYHLFALGALALVIWAVVRKARPSYLLYSGLSILLPLSTGMLRGIHRYLGSNFPLFLFLARLLKDRAWARRLSLGGGLALLALFSFKWGQGYHPN